MKKSEMIKKLEDSIWKNGGCMDNVQPDNLKNIAIGVLKDMIELGMKPPSVEGDKCQFLLHKYMDPSFSYWDEDFDKEHGEEYKDFLKRWKRRK